LERLAAVIAPDGYLVTGTAEMPERSCPAFQASDLRGLYLKRSTADLHTPPVPQRASFTPA
jgi:hypothetical protein